MLIDSLIFLLTSIAAIYLADRANSALGPKLLKSNYEEIRSNTLRMEELKSLIMLAMVHKDKEARRGLQDEFNELHGKVFFSRIAANSLALVLMMPAVYLLYDFFKDKELFLPPVNLFFILIFAYYLTKAGISGLLNYHRYRKIAQANLHRS
ncbi:MAG: hypothetical protein ACLFR2_10115 [Candidatus Kapaibacterium sp.]